MIAYDESRQRVVLFGGYDEESATYLGDTWEWDGGQWHFMTDTGPGPRVHTSVAYDGKLQHVMLLGGHRRDGDTRDTWQWDGVAWQEVFDPNKRPRARNGQGLAYDSRHRKLVMFGGGATGNTQAYSDTWASSVPDWKRRLHAGGPGGRFPYNAFAYDRAQGLTVQYSGLCVTSDTWGFDGFTWAMLPGAVPTPRAGPGIAYDSARHRLVLYGGDDCGLGAPADTWEWDGSDWQQVATSGPGPRVHAPALAYDAGSGMVILFGGAGETSTVMHDTWGWSGSTYRCAAAKAGDINCDGFVDDDDRRIVVSGEGSLACAPDDTRDLDGDGRITPADTAALVALCTRGNCERGGDAD